MPRSLPLAALLLAISACKPDLAQVPPTPVVNAVFDPTTAKIPLPNDLALVNPPNSVCPAPANMMLSGPPLCAQAELLASFGSFPFGAFPSDQEVAITIDFVQTNFANGTSTQSAPALDLSTLTPATLIVASTTPSSPGEVPLEPIAATDYAMFPDHGTLTLHHAGHAPWATGSYAVVMRGGPDGVKTTDQIPVSPSQVFDLVAQGQDMTDPKNLGLLKAQTGSTDMALTQGAQLNQLIGIYKASAFPVADMRFPHQEMAIATTFSIAPTVTNVTIDPARGKVPLPMDLLRDPVGGKLTPLAACTLAGSSLAADGNCATAAATAAAAGFKALDGFSTTGAILAPTSELIQTATVTAASLQLYDLTTPATPVLVDPKTLILEPCEFASACNSPTALSPVIAIQPSGATAGDPPLTNPPASTAQSVFRTKPLKDKTDYAVVMTTDIHDKAGNPIGPGTVAKILRFANPITVGGKSGLAGIDDGTAAALEKMRLQLKPVFDTLATAGTDRSKVAMAYTFHTQTILTQATQLAALPYGQDPATALPIVNTFKASPTVGDAYTKYGATGIPNSNIREILEVDINTFDALDPLTGAFLADPTHAVQTPIHVLIATPMATAKACPFPAPLDKLKCAPMMVFRHGLGRGRADMLLVADSFAKAGMVTVAIDAAKHGDRSFCTSGTTGTVFDPNGNPIGGCNTGVACTTALPMGAQGDANPPGTCAGDGKLFKLGVTGGPVPAGGDGIAVISSNYLVTSNFFRTRDTMRQDLIDESQLVRALAFLPNGTPHAVFDHMATATLDGIVIDPATIYFTGQSLGSIQGMMDVATNPRISKAVFNVGGGTIVDIFTNSPAFAPLTDQLLAGLGIDKVNNPSGFLQFLTVAKTVLDPADPINFAGHLQGLNTLTDFLHGGVQASKKVLTQLANCDGVVPNPFGFVYASNVGTGPLPSDPNFFNVGQKGTFEYFTQNGKGDIVAPCSATTAVLHGFLTDFRFSLAGQAQTDAANFVVSDLSPPSIQN